MKQRILVFLLFLFRVNDLSAQTAFENNFVRYSTADGISDNNIREITQDSTGFVWIATASGLNRYDGSRFVQFHSTGDSLSLASEDLTGMVWLNNDQLAIYTTGLHIINTKTGKTRNLFIPYHDQQYLYKFNTIMGAVGDNSGNIYI